MTVAQVKVEETVRLTGLEEGFSLCAVVTLQPG